MNQIIRDKKNNVVGYYRTVGNRDYVYDQRNHILGWHDRISKITRDGTHRFFGYGDQLSDYYLQSEARD